MRRAIALCLAAVVGVSTVAGAQQVSARPAARGGARSIVHYGKWATAATAVGLTILAAREHASAQDHWRQLIALCRGDNAACQLRNDGRYVDAGAERLYQQTAYYDRRARSRLLGGQVALLASAALFLVDLRHKDGDPPNIPFHGPQLTAQPAGDGLRLGVRLAF